MRLLAKCGLAGLLVGCGSGTAEEAPISPEGEVPRLGTRYRVEVELVDATNCGLDGLSPVAAEAIAKVDQSGAAVAWTQAIEGQASWRLNGRLCLREDGSADLALRGALRVEDDTVAAIGRDRVGTSLCEIRSVVPDAPAEDVSLCEDPNAIRLVMGECGVMTAEVSSRLSFSEDCAQDTPCRMNMRWRAVATKLPSLNPDVEAGLAFPLPCVNGVAAN